MAGAALEGIVEPARNLGWEGRDVVRRREEQAATRGQGWHKAGRALDREWARRRGHRMLSSDGLDHTIRPGPVLSAAAPNSGFRWTRRRVELIAVQEDLEGETLKRKEESEGSRILASIQAFFGLGDEGREPPAATRP